MDNSTIKEICDIVTAEVMKQVHANLSTMKQDVIEEITKNVLDQKTSGYSLNNRLTNINNNKNEKSCEFDSKECKLETISISPENAIKIDVEVDVGDVNIRYGDTMNVEIVARYYNKDNDKSNAILENLSLKSKIKGSTLYITMSEYNLDSNCGDIITDLDITLPNFFCGFNIKTNVGDIDLEMLKGSFDISTNVGDINLEMLKGSFDISVNVGDIYLNELLGSFRIFTNTGDIECSNVSVNDNSELSVNVGDIDISIKKVSECEVEITTDVGDIEIDTQALNFKERDREIYFDEGEEKTIEIENICTINLSTNVGEISIIN